MSASSTKTPGFLSMSDRVLREREERLSSAARGLNYHNAFLDDRLRAILPHDFVIITARSGAGKTELALDLAVSSSIAEREVGYFALEAEPLELERRMKFRWLVNQCYLRQIDGRDTLNFTDWLMGLCEDVVGHMEYEANKWFVDHLSTCMTYYKGVGRFDADTMVSQINEIVNLVDMFVLDHLHYVDAKDGDNDNRSLARVSHTLRDSALGLGKPVIAVAHLRKNQGQERTLLPDKDELMGSSELPKVATQIIALAPALFIEPPKWWLAPTLVGVIKDRRSGEDGLAALVMFDKRSRSYAEGYTLGRLLKGGTAWEQLKPGDVPSWARGHRQMELEMAATDAP